MDKYVKEAELADKKMMEVEVDIQQLKSTHTSLVQQLSAAHEALQHNEDEKLSLSASISGNTEYIP